METVTDFIFLGSQITADGDWSSDVCSSDLSFSFSISPSSEYSGLTSFRMDWFVLLALQGTLKSLLQHHYLKASIPQRSAFFMVQLSHPYMTTHKLGGVLKELVAGAQQVSKRELPLLPALSRALCSGFPSSAFTFVLQP